MLTCLAGCVRSGREWFFACLELRVTESETRKKLRAVTQYVYFDVRLNNPRRRMCPFKMSR